MEKSIIGHSFLHAWNTAVQIPLNSTLSCISEGISEESLHTLWVLRVPPARTTAKTISAVSSFLILVAKWSWMVTFEVTVCIPKCFYFYCFIDFQFSLLANPCPYINTYTNCDALIEEATCENSIVSEGCPASCLCGDKIIPIARKWSFYGYITWSTAIFW